MATIGKFPLESGTDFILYDPFSKRVFPINEKITVIDAGTGKVADTMDLGGDPEAAVSDGKGTVYINLNKQSPWSIPRRLWSRRCIRSRTASALTAFPSTP